MSTAKHVASLLTGTYALFLFFGVHMLWVLLLSLLCYLVLLLSRSSSSRGVLLSAVVLVYLLVGSVSDQLLSAFRPPPAAELGLTELLVLV